MTKPLQHLQSITKALLSHELDYKVLNEAVQDLYQLFCDAAGFDELQAINQEDIQTKTGKAIAPRWAASCITDMMRTRKFLLGIKEAIEERAKMNPGKPVVVLYAGTGPFATLLTPLVTVFSPQQLQLVLMEIHPVSFSILQKIIRHFGMEDYIRATVNEDAVTYSLSADQQPGILVSETMNNSLQKEPQVSVVANLLSQCRQQPLLVPECIKVEACLLGEITFDPSAVLSLHTLLELDASTAAAIKNNPEKVPALSPGIIVTINSSSPYKQLALCTSIKIFGEHYLGYNESGLTIPHILMMTDSFKKYPARFLFTYHIESNPGFRVRRVE